MSQELAQGIVAAARMLEAETPSRYASLQFHPMEELGWKAFLPNGESQAYCNVGQAVNYMQDNGFSISPETVEKFLAKRESHFCYGRIHALEFLVWTGM